MSRKYPDARLSRVDYTIDIKRRLHGGCELFNIADALGAWQTIASLNLLLPERNYLKDGNETYFLVGDVDPATEEIGRRASPTDSDMDYFMFASKGISAEFILKKEIENKGDTKWKK